MALVFQIPASGRNVRLPSLKVWFYLAVQGYIRLGTFGKFDYFGFRCRDCNALKVDYLHGYHEGEYYLQCPDCGCKQKCGDKP